MLRSGAAGCDGDQKYVFPEHNRWRAAGGRAAPRRNAAVWFWLRYFMVLINVLRRSVRLYHECFKAAFKVKWCNFLNWLLVSFWRCWVILSTLLTMTHHKPRYITTNSQKYVDIWRPSADEERSCDSLVEIGLNVNLNKKQQLVIIIIILFFFPYLCELQRATAQDCVRAFVSVKKSGFFFYEWQKTVFWCTITLWHCNKHTELQ